MIRKAEEQAIAPYLRDASNFSIGCAREVVVPESREELCEFLRGCDQPVTVAGAGTGLTAARVPQSGVVVSLERLKSIGEIENSTIELGPAVTLQELQQHLSNTPFFYPPNPTETLASIGGTVATNASGSRSYKYGVTRDYVEEAEIVLAQGRFVRLKRGLTIDDPLELDDGSIVEFPEVRFQSATCKNAAGYFVRPGMDWLDLFIGSEGTLGIVVKVRLKLLQRPKNFISAILFFETEEESWQLVDDIRSSSKGERSPCSLEYFDSHSLKRLKSKFSQIPESAQSALFFEQDVGKDEDEDALVERWYDYLSEKNVLLEESWFAQNQNEIQRFHDFRHELPVMINEENSRKGRVKMGTDLATRNDHFLDLMKFYRRQLQDSELDYVAFGHIGDNHLHINLLPEKGETDRARELYQKLVEQVLSWGGTISAEHGIGKLKKQYFAQMVGPEGLADLRKIKSSLDPDWLLGLGNTFDR